MGFLSNLFGGNKEDKALREALAHIHRILDDEKRSSWNSFILQ
jgi:hypothetical protein